MMSNITDAFLRKCFHSTKVMEKQLNTLKKDPYKRLYVLCQIEFLSPAYLKAFEIHF